MAGLRSVIVLSLTVAAVAGIGAFSIHWWVSTGGGPRRTAVSGQSLLLPRSIYPATGNLAALSLVPPETRTFSANTPEEGTTFLRVWDSGSVAGAYADLSEDVIVFSSTRKAASWQRYADAHRCDAAEYPAHTGPEVEVAASGGPNMSHYFCAWTDQGRCEAWTWTARYGQYMILIEYEGIAGERERTLREDEFVGIVASAAAQVASQL